jgi:predicted dehydrogenase
MRVTDDPGQLMAAPDIDAVVVATLPGTHYELSAQALEAGKDVFVEKPMVLDRAEGQRLVQIAERAGRILMVGHLMEYHPAVLKLKAYLDAGELGSIYYVYAARVNLGKVRREENALWSFAPHDISMILYLLGDVPVQVTATGQDYLRKGIEDVAFVTLRFKNGTIAHIHVSWLDPHKIRRLTVVGDKKMAVFDDMAPAETIRIYDKGVDQDLEYGTYGDSLSLRTGDILIPSVKMSEPLKLECAHFIDCVQSRETPRSDGRDGLRVVCVLQAAQRSLEQRGTPVAVE